MEAKLDILQLVTRYFRPHAFIYAVAVLLGLMFLLFSVGGWFFWPLLIWTIVFLAHFLIVKSMNIDSDWVAERTAKTADKAYDLSHVESIRERHHGAAPEDAGDDPATGIEADPGKRGA